MYSVSSTSPHGDGPENLEAVPPPDSQTLTVLEWPFIHDQLLDRCCTLYGQEAWQQQTFLDARTSVSQRLAEVAALEVLVTRYNPPEVDLLSVPDIRPGLARVAKGDVFGLDEIKSLLKTLDGGLEFIQHLVRGLAKEPQLTVLAPLLKQIPDMQPVSDYLAEKMDVDGELLDTASEALAKLSQRLRQETQHVRKHMQNLLNQPNISKALQDPVVTERSGRYVLPVKVAFKTLVPGIVHGDSASGSTLFVEPQSAVPLNNQVQATEMEIQKEIQKILIEMSEWFRTEGLPVETPQGVPESDTEETEVPIERIKVFLEILGGLDQRVAAAGLSQALHGEVPELVETTEASWMDLKQLRHPMLVFQQQKNPDHPVVANDFTLGKDGQRTLVITGPNTGGKTVLLKTVGLCLLMIRAGIPIPAGAKSSLSFIPHVYADIGDEQSIVQSLSTFSAHIQKLKGFLSQPQLANALVMVDEIAAGTDPTEGSALAAAILNALKEKGCLTVVTTHLGDLKLLAYQEQGYQNASVEFDSETLKPTYHLLQGVPGASHAIAIAESLGLAPKVIKDARHGMGDTERESAEMMEEMEKRSIRLQEELVKAESYRRESQTAYEGLEFERQQLRDEKRRTLQEFRAELKTRIQSLENQIKVLQKQLEQAKIKHPDRAVQTIRRFEKASDEAFIEAEAGLEKALPEVEISDIQVGDEVQIPKLNLNAWIDALHPDRKEVSLSAGNFKMVLPVSDIQLIRRRPGEKKPARKPTTPSYNSSHSKRSASKESKYIPLERDIRGMTAEEGLSAAEKYLDDAIQAGYTRVGIIHGHGTGVLKRAIREFLGGAEFVKKHYAADRHDGGDGKTIIEL